MTDKNRSSNLDTEDYISLISLIVLGLFVVVLMVLFGKYTKTFTDLSFLRNIMLIKNKESCSRFNGKFEQCVKAQQSGYGCSWYSGCNVCLGLGMSSESACVNKDKKIPKKDNNPDQAPKPEEIENFVSCNQLNNNFQQCVKAQQSGYGCSWYSGCKACISQGEIGEDICSSLNASVTKTITPTTQANNDTKDCSAHNNNFQQCVKAQQSGYGCSWYSGCKACISQGETGEDVCKKITNSGN